MASTQIGEGAAAAHRAQLAPEDESEWEYEYSNTETETFYVTLDLSTADFTAPHKNVTSNSRMDYQGKPMTEAERVRHKYKEHSPIGEDAEDEDGQEVRQPRASPEPGPAARNSRAGSNDDATAEFSEKVQIMELHSPNPVVSYKGWVYEGQWSQHVGTELLLARRDESRPLPAVRRLDHGVDLLAAGCARITVAQKELERKDTGSTQRRAKLARDEREALAKIPKPETKPSAARVAQGNFLAKLIALKKRRGEADEVPVLVNGHVRDLWVKGSHRGRGTRGRGRGRPRGKGRGAGLLRREVNPSTGSAQARSVGFPDSTPTPAHWDDLSNANADADGLSSGSGCSGSSDDEEEDENAMEVDEGSNESEYSDEGSMAEGENDYVDDDEDEDEDRSGADEEQSDDEDSDGDEMDVDED